MNKNGISATVATSLLLVVSVLAVIGFNSWYNTYSSSLLLESEKTVNLGFENSIEGIINNFLYIKTSSNLSIKDIKIDGISCLIKINISGIEKIDVSNCIENISTSTPEIIVVTDNKLLTKQIYLDNSAISNNNLNPLCSNLELLMHFNNDSLFNENDSFVYDHTGNGHNSILFNGDVKYNSTEKKFGSNSLEFDAVGDSLDINFGNGFNASTSNLTYSVWLKINISESDSGGAIVLSQSSGTDRTYMGMTSLGSEYSFGLQSGTFDAGLHRSGVTPSQDWELLTITLNGTHLNLYLNNGTYLSSNSYTSFLFNENLRIGDYHTGSWGLSGFMDELMVWNKALTSEEIRDVYNLNSELNC